MSGKEQDDYDEDDDEEEFDDDVETPSKQASEAAARQMDLTARKAAGKRGDREESAPDIQELQRQINWVKEQLALVTPINSSEKFQKHNDLIKHQYEMIDQRISRMLLAQTFLFLVFFSSTSKPERTKVAIFGMIMTSLSLVSIWTAVAILHHHRQGFFFDSAGKYKWGEALGLMLGNASALYGPVVVLGFWAHFYHVFATPPPSMC